MPFPFNCCFRSKNTRSEVYYGSPNEEDDRIEERRSSDQHQTTKKVTLGNTPSSNVQPSKYSWDIRRSEAIDLSKYRVRDIDGDFVLKNDLNGQQLSVENCKRSVIAVLDVTGSIVVDYCIDCTFVIGPCMGSLFIRDCANCRVFYVGQQFRLRDCKEMDIALYCRTQPIIESANNIRFYPLNLSYPKLHDHLSSIGMSAFGSPSHSIHDYTPTSSTTNYSIIDDELRMDLASARELRRVGGISLDYIDSVFIQKDINSSNNSHLSKIMLMALQRSGETYKEFYDKCYSLAFEAHKEGIKFGDIVEGIIDEELGDILKEDYTAQLKSRLIILDILGEKEEMSSILEGSFGKIFKIVPSKYRSILSQRFFPS